MDFMDIPRPTRQEMERAAQVVHVMETTELQLQGITSEQGLRMVVGRNPESAPGKEDVDIHLHDLNADVSRRAAEIYMPAQGGLQILNCGAGALRYQTPEGAWHDLTPEGTETSAYWIPKDSDLRNVRLEVDRWTLEVSGFHQASGEPTRVTEILIRRTNTQRKQIDWNNVQHVTVQPK